MKLAVWRWLPAPDVNFRHLLWLPKWLSSQCAVIPIYKQLLDTIHISVVPLKVFTQRNFAANFFDRN